MGLFWCVCFTLNSRSWEWLAILIKSVFTFSDCLLMLSYTHLKSSDISIGNLPGKISPRSVKILFFDVTCCVPFLIFAITAYRTLNSLSSSLRVFRLMSSLCLAIICQICPCTNGYGVIFYFCVGRQGLLDHP